MTAHLRMNAVYWGLTALCIMNHKDELDAEDTIEYVMNCWDDKAGAHKLNLPPPAHPARTNHLYTNNSSFKKVHLAHTRDTTHTFFPR